MIGRCSQFFRSFLAMSLMLFLPQLAMSNGPAKKDNPATISTTPAGKGDNQQMPAAHEEGEGEGDHEFIPSGESADFEDIELED